MPPRYLLEKTVSQCKEIAAPAGEANVFGHPVKQFPDGVPQNDRKRLHDDIVAAVDHKVRPAYSKLAEFLAKDYAPEGRAETGFGHCPTATRFTASTFPRRPPPPWIPRRSMNWD